MLAMDTVVNQSRRPSPDSDDATYHSSFPSLFLSFPFLTGVREYSPPGNFGIKDACEFYSILSERQYI